MLATILLLIGETSKNGDAIPFQSISGALAYFPPSISPFILIYYTIVDRNPKRHILIPGLIKSFYVSVYLSEMTSEFTSYASLMLMVPFVSATCPAIPVPNGTFICLSSDTKLSAKVLSAVTSNNLDAK